MLKPNYKKGWTIPGGQMDATGEAPLEARVRETLEECGLEPRSGRLVLVDFRRPRPNRPGGMRFLFHCGSMTDPQLAAIRLQADEIDEYLNLADLDDALTLLSGPIRRRVAAGVGAKRCVYLEDGRPVEAVRG